MVLLPVFFVYCLFQSHLLKSYLFKPHFWVFVTLNSLEMVTALFIQLSSLVFLDGVKLSRNLSVQITHANAIEAHLRTLSRITPRIKAVGGSLKK